MDRPRFSTAGRRRPRRPRLPAALGQRGLLNGLALFFGLLLFLYLSSGNRLVLLALVAAVAIGMDQALRTHPQADFRGVEATAIYLFVPVLFAIGAALFLRDTTGGVVVHLLAAAGAAVVFGLAARAEYVTVDASPETYPVARFALSLVSYLTAFALFTVVFTSSLPLPAATLIVAVTALLLTVDILRELEVQTGTLFAYAAAVAAVIAEARWALYYLGLPDLLSGALLLVAFYELTGLVQSYLSGHLDRRTMQEFGVIGVVGAAIVAGASVLSRRA